MPSFVDLTGRTFGRWTVLRRAPDYCPPSKPKGGYPRWWCRCECGTEKIVKAGPLSSGQSQSCGCYNLEVRRRVCIERNTTHGQAARGAKTRTYRIWSNLTIRCDNAKSKTYARYGGRGIGICDRWRSFENFLADMGECPSDKHTLDRIDGHQGYAPANCRWATMREQNNNRLNNRRITFNGETLTLMEWSRRTGLPRETIHHRLGKLGWPLEQAMTLPPSPTRREQRR